MRKLLLTSVAVVALAAGCTAANAQTGTEPGKDRPPAASSQRTPEKAGAREEKGMSGAAGRQSQDGKSPGAQNSRGAHL